MDGLDDVIAAETALSDVDGEAGRLIIKGFALEDLAGRASFEDAAGLLLSGLFDDLPARTPSPAAWARPAPRCFPTPRALTPSLAARPPVDAVRALIALLPDGDDLDVAFQLLAAPAVFTAAVVRHRQGLAPLAPDPALGHAADILRMLKGAPASAAEAGRWTLIW